MNKRSFEEQQLLAVTPRVSTPPDARRHGRRVHYPPMWGDHVDKVPYAETVSRREIIGPPKKR